MSPMSMWSDRGNPPVGATDHRSEPPSAPPNMMLAPSGDHWGAAPETSEWTDTRSAALSTNGSDPACADARGATARVSAAAPTAIRTRCILSPV